MNQEQLLQLALSFIPGVGPTIGKTLLSYCGSLEAVFKSNKSSLLKIPGLGEKTAQTIISCDALTRAENELEIIIKQGLNFSFFHDEDYPSRLKQYADAPLILYYKGQKFPLRSRTVAIVGTRDPSEYGKLAVQSLVSDLTEYGVCVISGMAYGIDTFAHLESVRQNIPTYGILGQGLKYIYPAQNRKLAAQMLDQGGLITEFPYESKPDREHFPMRNRVIAGLSDAVVVIESAASGGSIITANFANDYFKDVFAIPGRLGDEKSVGCNKLIKEHKANLLQSGKDLAYIMGWEKSEVKQAQMQIPLVLNEDESRVIDVLKEQSPRSIDQLHYALKMSLSELSSILLNLEFKGMIRSMPGKNYNLLL